jgi:hypothetical protein
MSRLEDRIAAPPALPPIRPPRGGRRDDDEPSQDPARLPLWVKPRRNLGVIARVGVKFPARPGDKRLFGAKSLPLTTCIVFKVIPPGARRSAYMMAPSGYHRNSWAPLIGPKKLPRFKTKAEKRRHSKRWLHGFTREREFLLRGPRCWTFAGVRYMMEKTAWTMTLKLRIAPKIQIDGQ